MNRDFSIEDVETLFMRFGNRAYDGERQETVSVLEHALQSAQQAEWADADEALVGAAFLHDLGHLLAQPDADGNPLGDAHVALGVPLLEAHFGEDVVGPIRLHSAARRYLAATDPAYLKGLSPAALQSLALQGGAMAAAEVKQFEVTPYAMDAVQLRRWDELAQVPGQRTPPIDYYLALLEDLQRQTDDRDKLEVGPQTVT